MVVHAGLKIELFIPVIQKELEGAFLIWANRKSGMEIASNVRGQFRILNGSLAKFLNQRLVQGFGVAHGLPYSPNN